MRFAKLSEVWTAGAGWLIVLRGATVGVHFAVMVWLAKWLGLAEFGALAHLWALALFASTIIAAGGPLILLRAPSDEVLTDFLRVGFGHPLVLAAVAAVLCAGLNIDVPWAPVLAMALAIVCAQNVASVIRVWGNVSVSMVLRDGLSVVVLGVIAVLPTSPEVLLYLTALVVTVISLGALVVATMTRRPAIQVGALYGQASLWLSSVLGMAQAQADLIVAGLFLPAEVFGLYALLRRIANLVALPVSVAAWVSAGPVARAFSDRDPAALRAATRQASAVGWYPACALSVLAGGSIAVLVWMQSISMPVAMLPVFVVLVAGALLQSFWAASFPVANLGPAPEMAVHARGLALAVYVSLALWSGGDLSVFGHALAYVSAVSVGNLHLWTRVRHTFAVDTSAAVLWRRPVLP